MSLKLIVRVSRGLLLARWKQTLVAAMGVTFSIMMFIGLLAFMDGLNGLLDGLMMNRTPHIRLYNEIKPSAIQPIDKSPFYNRHYNFVRSVKPKNERLELYNNGAIMQALKQDERVLGVAPKITAQVFYNVGAIDLTGAISGIDVEEENRLFLLKDYVVAGNYLDLKNIPNSIVLGKGAATKMLAELGDIIQVTTVKGERVQLKVVGYFQSGIQELDNVQSYTSIKTAQKLLGESNSYVTDIQIKLKNILLAPALAKEYHTLFQ
jgi:lipoprotein-releasing system permease protein